MSHRHHTPGLLGPTLLIVIHLALDGCAGLSPQPPARTGSTPVTAAKENQTGDQPAATVSAESLEAVPAPAGFPPPAVGQTRHQPAGGKRLDPPRGLQLLPGSPELQLRYAELLREMGTAAEQQRLREHLALDMDDPATLNFVITWYLAREEFDAARYWVRRAQADNQPVPLWQRLVLALDDGDPEAVERLLRESEDELPATTQIESLRQVGLNEQALALAQNYLESLPSGQVAEELVRQVDTLALPHAHLAGFEWAKEKLGSLHISSGTALLNLDSSRTRVAVEITQNRLDSDGSDVLFVDEFDSEVDVSLRAARTQPSAQMELELGGNLRDDKSILYGQLIWAQRVAPDMFGRLELGFNEITNATPILRAIGTKDYFSLATTTNLTRWEFARAKLELHRYQTRDDNSLGTGYGAEAALGHILLQELPRWHMEIRGSWERNQLKDDLPPELSSSVLSVSTEVDDIIPPDYGTLGIGTTLRYGSSDSGPKRLMHVLLDAWTGWIWPDEELAYNVRLGLGTSIFSRDKLSLDAYYANAQSGVTSEAFWRFGISYTYYF